MTGWISFNEWPLIGDHNFNGLANYKYIGADTQFWTSLWFTTRFALVVTPGTVVIGFGLSLLVRRAIPGITALRTAYFLPVVVGMSACSYIWYWMFNDRVGIVDAALRSLGLIHESTEWLADPTTAFIAIAVITIWKSTGFSMVMFMVGLHEIPEEVFEAARVDGASAFQTVWRIALPLLRQTIALVLVLAVIGSFLAFDQFYIMTRGGPQNQTISIVYWIFSNGFVYYRLGYGSALAVVLLLILLVLSAIQLRGIRRPAEA
jgi:multiple sugar transport system permease protein